MKAYPRLEDSITLDDNLFWHENGMAILNNYGEKHLDEMQEHLPYIFTLLDFSTHASANLISDQYPGRTPLTDDEAEQLFNLWINWKEEE